MNIICLDCAIADPEAVWEYEDSKLGWIEAQRLVIKHQTHRLIFLGVTFSDWENNK